MATSVVTALKKSIQIRSKVVLIRHSQFRIQTLRLGGWGGDGHPDPKIRGAGLQKIFSALRASVRSKNTGGWAPRALPLDPPLIPTPFEGN